MKSCVQGMTDSCIVVHILHTTFHVPLSHYGFVQCKIVLHFELPQHCTSELCAPCLCTGHWYFATYCTIRLENFTVHPTTQNLVLLLIWYHSIHPWLRTNLGKLTFETTLVHVYIQLPFSEINLIRVR